MVKVEKVTLSSPDLPVPPGFSPKTPPPKRATNSAADGTPQPMTPPAPPPSSSRNQNPTLKQMSQHIQVETPGLSIRRSTRKRVPPKFYSPAPAHQYRGRKKARSISRLSHQEKVTGNCNQLSMTLSRWQELMLQSPPSIHSTGEQSSSQMNNRLSQESNETTTTPLSNQQIEQAPSVKAKYHGITVNKNQASDAHESTVTACDSGKLTFRSSRGKVPCPLNGLQSGQNSSPNERTSQSFDPEFLQHVANALNSTRTSQNGKTVKAKSPNIKTDLHLMLNAINKKHGDITKHCSLESDRMKTLVLFGICEVVQDLQKKQLKDVDISMLEACYSAVRDAEQVKMNVKWLRDRLDEIKDAIQLSGETKSLTDEKERQMKKINYKRKAILLHKNELKKLNSEIEEMENELALEIVKMEELDENFKTRTSKFQHLQKMPLIEGLI